MGPVWVSTEKPYLMKDGSFSWCCTAQPLGRSNAGQVEWFFSSLAPEFSLGAVTLTPVQGSPDGDFIK